MTGDMRPYTSGIRYGPEGSDCVILPGGFSYGDYLRCGAIAKFFAHHGRGEALCRRRRTGLRNL